MVGVILVALSGVIFAHAELYRHACGNSPVSALSGSVAGVILLVGLIVGLKLFS